MARKAGLCWYNTPLPIRQVNLVPPNQPKHSPFVHFIPKELAVEEPTAHSDSDDDNDDKEEPAVDDGARGSSDPPAPSRSSAQLVAAPFRMGPTPSLVRTVVPQGETKGMYPRGNPLNCVRTDKHKPYTGPACYQWDPIVSNY